MNAEKPPTVRAQLDSLRADIQSLIDALQPRDQGNAAPPPMTEARALDVCMEALAAMEQRERDRRSNTYTMGGSYGNATDRILRHLAMRFGLDLIEARYEPCSRMHLELSAYEDLAAALGRLRTEATP